MIETEKFNSFINEFKKLTVDSKKQMVIEEFKKTLALVQMMKTSLSIDTEILYNKEMINSEELLDEENFTESVMVYLYSIRESISEIYNEVFDSLNNNEKE